MNKSTEIKNISVAMIKVQSEIKGMTPDAKNPFFKSNYITLDGILEYIRPILSKNEVWLVQEAKGLDNTVEIKTCLYHSSGEFIETESLEMIPSKNDPQVLGSLITYLKRYQLSALLGISSEVDDDANKATGNKPNKPTENKAPVEDTDKITTQMLIEIAAAKGFNEEQVCKKYKAKEAKFIKQADKKDAYENFKKLPDKLIL